MSAILTAALLAFCIALALVAGWRGGRPPDLARGPRMVPWRFIMLLSATLAFLLLVHLAYALFGGPPPRTY